MIDFDELEAQEEERARHRVAFVDFWPGFDDGTDRFVSKHWFVENLADLEVVHPLDEPAVIIFSVFGSAHAWHMRRGRAKMVFYTGENVRPPLGQVPLCFSYDHIPGIPSAAHMRLPLWVLDRDLPKVMKLHEARLRGEYSRQVRKRSGFCSWVAGNECDRDAGVRLRFVRLLSAGYHAVACGGKVLNNVGGPVDDKIEFLRGYRFNVAFENASHPGYCTEKLLHAFAAECVPIYWGDPHTAACGGLDGESEADFNPSAMISAHDFDSFEDLVAHVAKVDRDPELFEAYLRQPILSERWYRKLRDWPAFCQELTELILLGADEFSSGCACGDVLEDDCMSFGGY